MNEKLKKAGATDWELEWIAEMVTSFDDVKQSHEYGAYIIHSLETGTPRVVYGNVMNNGLIDNLPQNCCVEAPVLVDKSGLQPTKVGALPPHLAALMQTQINVQSLTVEAALTRKRDHIYHAAMLDPHTSAELDLDQIWSMVDELIAAHGDWLPTYQ
jgi:alpha-galactosidase